MPYNKYDQSQFGYQSMNCIHDMNETQARAALKDKPAGTFLVRYSNTLKHTHVLVCKREIDSVTQVPIEIDKIGAYLDKTCDASKALLNSLSKKKLLASVSPQDQERLLERYCQGGFMRFFTVNGIDEQLSKDLGVLMKLEPKDAKSLALTCKSIAKEATTAFDELAHEYIAKMP